jgi:hypothetical protein
MKKLNSHPFLLSLRQEITPADNLQAHKSLLYRQQKHFKDYVEECCVPDISAPVRFEFLKLANYELCSIRLQYADTVRESDAGFYHFWSMMIVDTRRFLSVGIDTINFQMICPPHLLTASTPTFPAYKWTGSRADLTEGLAALYQADVIRQKDGSRVPFALFANFVGRFFGITYSNPRVEMQKVINRKKNPTPFLSRLISCLKEKSVKDDEFPKNH